MKKKYLPLILLLPGFLGLAITIAYPWTMIFDYAFKDSSFWLAPPGEWNWFENFIKTFNDPRFWTSLRATAIFSVTLIVFDTIIGLGVAGILSQKFKGVSIVTALMLLPWIISVVATSIMWRLFLDPRFGIVDVLLFDVLGIEGNRIMWMEDPTYAWFSLIIVAIWKGYPLQSLVFYAAMQGIPVEMYESALLDGASGWKRFWHITIPQLKPILILMNLFLLIWTCSGIEFVYTLTEGGPGFETMILPVYAYRNMFKNYNMGVASAQMVILLLIVSVILAISLKIREIRRVD